MAIEHGACLVPVFSFGETDIYDQVNNPRGSRLREWQDSLLRVFGFSMPLIKGRDPDVICARLRCLMNDAGVQGEVCSTTTLAFCPGDTLSGP